MKLPTSIQVLAFTLLATFHSSCWAEESRIQVQSNVEVLELPRARALEFQKSFLVASDEKRASLVLGLSTNPGKNGKVVSTGRRLCRIGAGEPSRVDTIQEYRYPTEFSEKDGLAVPTAFESRNVGSMMELTIAAMDKDGLFQAKTIFQFVTLVSTTHFAASKTDKSGSIVQPIFNNETVATNVLLKANVPGLVSTYSPYPEKKSADVLRLVFVTIQPEP